MFWNKEIVKHRIVERTYFNGREEKREWHIQESNNDKDWKTVEILKNWVDVIHKKAKLQYKGRENEIKERVIWTQ